MNKLHEHLNPAVRNLRPSVTLLLSERAEALRASGKTVAKLALGQSPFPVPERMIQALRDAAAIKDYVPTLGLPELRRAIAAHVEKKLGIDRTSDDVIVGPGSKELLFLLLLVFDGEVIVPTPSWTAHAAQAQLLGRQVLTLHGRAEHGYLLQPAQLDEALSSRPWRPRLLLLNYPANPTGLTYRPEELREMARIARRHRLLVVSDEIYAELHHKGQHASIARHYPEGTVVSTGLSKWMGAGGWRLGALVFPEPLRPYLDALEIVASETYTATSAPIQQAACVAFEGGDDIDRYLANVRRVLSALGRFTSRKLDGLGASTPRPSGGFYVFPDFGRTAAAARFTSSTQLCEQLLLERGLALVPGAAFGRPDAELTARLAFVDFDGSRALAAVNVIPKEQPVDEVFLRRHCAPVLDALDALGPWLGSS